MKKINVVLYHPEIPENTGNIMRSCVGFNAKLHLIRPFGFVLDEKKLRRSALDYFDYLEYEVYDDFADFLSKNKGKFMFFTRYGHKSPNAFDYKSLKDENLYLVFGSESKGIAYDILKDNLEDCYRIPTTDKIRSLNLSNSAAIAMYVASMGIGDKELLFDEPDIYKGKRFLEDIDLSTLDYRHKENF